MKKFKKAFSLIELSIVLLIIGILIAGVTQSSRLISQMKLSSGRSLTESSPVSSIKGLVLWLETTSEKAFSKENEDGVAIANDTLWLDRNSQISQKANASVVNAPTFIDNCINGLPCLSFSQGSSTGLKVSQSLGLAQQGISVFVVLKTASTLTVSDDYSVVLSTGTHGAGEGSFQVRMEESQSSYDSFDQNTTQVNTYITPVIQIAANNSYIIGAVDNGAKVFTYSFGLGDPRENDSDVVGETKNLNNELTIGYFQDADERYFDGYIAEIILFDRPLKTEERASVQEYLGKKWGIKIN